MKIVDCFIFYNEIDLLTYRLNILNDLVDYFVIVESKYTFIGKEKELYYLNNKKLYEKFEDKIIHIIVDNIPFLNANIREEEQWKNEKFQRNCISRGINQLNDDDLIMISDIDEIPDPEVLKKIKNNEITFENAIRLKMDLYYYNLNTKYDYEWCYFIILKYKYYKTSNMTCQELRESQQIQIEKGGWHLSYFGDKNFISNKIKNFSHQEYNNNYYTDTNMINEKINNSYDLFDRSFKIEKIPVNENKYLPPEAIKYLSKFIFF